MKTTIVVPTIREEFILAFLDAWREPFSQSHIIIVEDNPLRTIDFGKEPNVTHYAWADIDRELGTDSWIIPRRTDCIRSFGYFKAWQERPDMIVTLDDDCYPSDGRGGEFLDHHRQRLFATGRSEAWQTSAKDIATRGVPYYSLAREWPVVVNHGMWLGVPDYDAPSQLVRSRLAGSFAFENQTIPTGKYFPMCGMNLAFRADVVPALYFLLMGRDYEYDRFGDIWAGIFVKKICDHLGYAIHSGEPAVSHQRASNVWANLRKEAAALEMNESLWQAVDQVVLTGTTFGDCYQELADKLPLEGDYWTRLRRAMAVWRHLFDDQGEVILESIDDFHSADLSATDSSPTGLA